jgi:hypothetical protein
MPPSFKRPCPACPTGVGLALSVRTFPNRPGLMGVRMRCQACFHEWSIEWDRDVAVDDDRTSK